MSISCLNTQKAPLPLLRTYLTLSAKATIDNHPTHKSNIEIDDWSKLVNPSYTHIQSNKLNFFLGITKFFTFRSSRAPALSHAIGKHTTIGIPPPCLHSRALSLLPNKFFPTSLQFFSTTKRYVNNRNTTFELEKHAGDVTTRP